MVKQNWFWYSCTIYSTVQLYSCTRFGRCAVPYVCLLLELLTEQWHPFVLRPARHGSGLNSTERAHQAPRGLVRPSTRAEWSVVRDIHRLRAQVQRRFATCSGPEELCPSRSPCPGDWVPFSGRCPLGGFIGSRTRPMLRGRGFSHAWCRVAGVRTPVCPRCRTPASQRALACA